MAKKQTNKNKPSQVWKYYDSSGNKTGRFCPKCGPGVFMAKHPDRYVCGNCKYVEFDKKESKKEE